MKMTRTLTAAAVAMTLAMTGACSNNKTTTTAGASAAEQEYESKLRALREREAALSARETHAGNMKPEVIVKEVVREVSVPAPAQAAMSGNMLLPPNAKPGECYARVWIAPQFKTVTERVLAKEAAERLEVIPAKYGYEEQRVLVSEAAETLTAVPATYKQQSERIRVRDEDLYWTFGTSGPASAKGSKAKRADDRRLSIARTNGLPDNAQTGQCFAEYYIAEKYATRSERVLAKEATRRLQVTPAKYGNVTERVLVKEASSQVRTIPAKYDTRSERVLVKPAYTTWKVSECSGAECQPGQIANRVSGVRERIDQATGEIMCLVEVPAQYKTVSKRVMVSPPSTTTVEIPAEYKNISVRKMVTPPAERYIDIPEEYQTVSRTDKVTDSVTSWHIVGSANARTAGQPTGDVFCMNATPAQYKTITKTVEATPASSKRNVVPARYETVKVRKLVQPASERRIPIPEEYQTVTRTEQVSDGRMEWRTVLCSADMTNAKIGQIQTALRTAGTYRGPIDGVFGSQSITAMRKFQRAKGLTSTRYLTIETVKALGVNP